MSSSDFIKALENEDLSALEKIPKADLHNHASLGFRKTVLEEWMKREFPDPPERMLSFADFTEYLNKHFHPIIYSRKGFEFSIKAALEQAVLDSVVELEMSIDSQVPGLYEEGAAGLAEFLISMHAEVASEIRFRPEIGVNREVDPDLQYERVVPMIDSGVFKSIDLYGNESTGPPEAFIQLYRYAGSKGLKRKAHAGEYGNAEFVRKSIETLELDEVQHGIAASQDKEVLGWLRRAEVRLNICPTSNLRLNRVKNLAEHPVRMIADAGVIVTINSDDILVFNKSVSEEYLALHKEGLFTPEELDTIRRFSLNQQH